MFVKEIMERMDTDPLPVRRHFVQMELDMTLAMFRAGVPFMAGTDTAAGVHVFPGFSLHEELALFVKAGLTPLQALQAATLNPARFLGRTADMGSVAEGKVADLLLLDANPLDDIDNTRRISGVLLAGRYFDRAALDRMLKGVAAAAAEPEARPSRPRRERHDFTPLALAPEHGAGTRRALPCATAVASCPQPSIVASAFFWYFSHCGHDVSIMAIPRTSGVV